MRLTGIALLAFLLAGCSTWTQSGLSTTRPVEAHGSLRSTHSWALDVIVVTGPADVADLAGNNTSYAIDVPADSISLEASTNWTCTSGPTCHLAIAIKPPEGPSQVAARGDGPLDAT